jgi:hypothetical protein
LDSTPRGCRAQHATRRLCFAEIPLDPGDRPVLEVLRHAKVRERCMDTLMHDLRLSRLSGGAKHSAVSVAPGVGDPPDETAVRGDQARVPCRGRTGSTSNRSEARTDSHRRRNLTRLKRTQDLNKPAPSQRSIAPMATDTASECGRSVRSTVLAPRSAESSSGQRNGPPADAHRGNRCCRRCGSPSYTSAERARRAVRPCLLA